MSLPLEFRGSDPVRILTMVQDLSLKDRCTRDFDVAWNL